MPASDPIPVGKAYRDAEQSQVLVLGDSFLRVYERDDPGAAGFIAHLARELGQPLTSIVNDGGGIHAGSQALAHRPRLLMNKKLVIWEFAERNIRFGLEGWQIVSLPGKPSAPRSQSDDPAPPRSPRLARRCLAAVTGARGLAAPAGQT